MRIEYLQRSKKENLNENNSLPNITPEDTLLSRSFHELLVAIYL